MTLYIKQKVFSWNDRFSIRNDGGDDIFRVEGEIFSLGRKLHVYDMQGCEIAFIRQKLLSFLPQYFIELQGHSLKVIKDFTLFKQQYRIEGTSWYVMGDFWAHEYAIYDGSGRVIMQMHKEWFTWGDSYALHIHDDSQALLCCCIALVIDCALADEDGAAYS